MRHAAARVPVSPPLLRAGVALLLLSAAALYAPGTARAQGLNLAPLDSHSLRWQARVQLSSLDERDSGRSLLSANLLGDYYLSSATPGSVYQGGLRTTGGLLIGSRALNESSAGLALRNPQLGQRASLVLGQRRIAQFGPSLPSASDDYAARPYLGIGYTGQSLRGGWGFSADLGLIKLSYRDELRLGRSPGGTQSLEELLQDMRLRPVVQLGFNYSF